MVTWQEDGSHDNVDGVIDISNDLSLLQMLIARREELVKLPPTMQVQFELAAIASFLARTPVTVKNEPKYNDGPPSLPAQGGTR